MVQPIKKNKFSYFARSRLRLRPQEIKEQDYDLICEHLESLTVEIKKPTSRPFAVMTWYTPPDSSIDLFKPFEERIGDP